MTLYKKILTAVDLTAALTKEPNKELNEEAGKEGNKARDNNSLIMARSLAISGNKPQSIHLIHACEHPVTGYGESTGRNHAVTEIQIRQQVFPKLSQLAERFHIPQENLHIDFGSPAEVVHQLAHKIQADLIVSGSHGKSGLSLLLGSTASSILHDAKCDLLTVRISTTS